MSRTEKDITPLNPADDQMSNEIIEAKELQVTQLNTLEATVAEGVAFGELLGQIKTGSTIATMANLIALNAFEYLKKSKAYLKMRNPKNAIGGNYESFSEFCEIHLNISYRTLQRSQSHRQMLGDELYEQARELNLQVTDFAQIKKLPLEKRTIVEAAIATGSSREDVVKVLCEITTKDQETIDEQATEIAELKQSDAAKDKLLADKNAKIDKLEAKNTVRVEVDWVKDCSGCAAQITVSLEMIKSELTKIDAARVALVGISQTEAGAANPAALAAEQARILTEAVNGLNALSTSVQVYERKADISFNAVSAAAEQNNEGAAQ